MTEEELIVLLSDRWPESSADGLACRVCDAEAVGVLYRLETFISGEMPNSLRHRLLFRGAYVLERICFRNRAAFLPYVENFCRRAFSECTDPSARRPFGKIMADLLECIGPDAGTLACIAETAADPTAKVAVRIWAVEVLKHCRGRVAWVEEVWPDLLELQSAGATPGIVSRMRRSWRNTHT